MSVYHLHAVECVGLLTEADNKWELPFLFFPGSSSCQWLAENLCSSHSHFRASARQKSPFIASLPGLVAHRAWRSKRPVAALQSSGCTESPLQCSICICRRGELLKSWHCAFQTLIASNQGGVLLWGSNPACVTLMENPSLTPQIRNLPLLETIRKKMALRHLIVSTGQPNPNLNSAAPQGMLSLRYAIWMEMPEVKLQASNLNGVCRATYVLLPRHPHPQFANDKRSSKNFGRGTNSIGWIESWVKDQMELACHDHSSQWRHCSAGFLEGRPWLLIHLSTSSWAGL